MKCTRIAPISNSCTKSPKINNLPPHRNFINYFKKGTFHATFMLRMKKNNTNLQTLPPKVYIPYVQNYMYELFNYIGLAAITGLTAAGLVTIGVPPEPPFCIFNP